ncbi:MAG TPA: GIY-YIG nuclease family protein [Ignavibacteriaceae bacterium]|nr:GIY-YIG nuclease family protein [Ignavibacteriaceae bacterium]
MPVKMVVYILQSLVKERYYIGCTSNLNRRLEEHNSGKTRSTKAYKPWKIVYIEEIISSADAYKREKEIKSYKGGLKFKELQNTERWQSG